MSNQVVWFDLPVKDMARAVRFYAAVLGCEVKQEKMEGGMEMAVLPHQGQDVGGCLVRGKDQQPSDKGPLLYFNAEGRLDRAIAAVAPNGGTVLAPRHAIGPYGFRAIVKDSEGNRIALHAMS